MKKNILLILPILLLGCNARVQTPDAPVALELPTQTTMPTHTPVPTETAVPTETPVPTATFTASPTPFVPPVFTPFPQAELGAIVMDGFVDDWARFEPLFVDAAGDAGASGVDITEIYAAHTDTHLLFSIHLGKVVDIEAEQALQITMQLGDREIRYNFGDRIGRLDGASVRQADIGLVSLPTVTSDVFEISFPHEGAFDQPVMVLFSDPAEGGDIASPDDAPLVYDWRNPIESAPPRSIDKPEGAVRLVSWNILRDNIFDRNLGVHFERVLKALQPDVILIQEVYIYSEKTALNRVNEWLEGEWYAKQQGDVITISRFPFIEDWREGNHNLRARIFPTMIDVDGSPLVLFNAHLSCCDRDQDRQDEVDSFIGFLREVGIPAGTPFILAGDLNLVGDAQQLTTLLTGNIIDEDKFGPDFIPDWDGTGLKDLVPGHTHSNFTTTWRDDESSYAPGRLDFIIYSDSVLNVQGFVIETFEMPQDVLDAYGLQADDTAGSDHLPLVADIVIIR